MTELTERERQIVAWLRGPVWQNMTMRRRIGMAIRCVIDPTIVGAAFARNFANAIERGEPWGEQA